MTIEAVYEADDNGENGDDAEQAAQAVIDDFDGDLSHMDAMVESLEESDALEMIMNVDMTVDDGEIESQSLNVDEGYGEIVAELESDHSIVAVTIEESDIYTDTRVINAVFYSGE